MKYKLLFLILSGMLIGSCGGKEFEEGCEDLSVVLIGEWESIENPGIIVEFREEHVNDIQKVVKDNGFLFADFTFSFGEVVSKSYSVADNEKIKFIYTFGLLGILIRDGEVNEFTCNTFKIEINGERLNFTKK